MGLLASDPGHDRVKNFLGFNAFVFLGVSGQNKAVKIELH
jgi:hypothetical protein